MIKKSQNLVKVVCELSGNCISGNFVIGNHFIWNHVIGPTLVGTALYSTALLKAPSACVSVWLGSPILASLQTQTHSKQPSSAVVRLINCR